MVYCDTCDHEYYEVAGNSVYCGECGTLLQYQPKDLSISSA